MRFYVNSARSWLVAACTRSFIFLLCPCFCHLFHPWASLRTPPYIESVPCSSFSCKMLIYWRFADVVISKKRGKHSRISGLNLSFQWVCVPGRDLDKFILALILTCWVREESYRGLELELCLSLEWHEALVVSFPLENGSL